MAGTEKTGVAFSQPNLFEKAVCVVTPTSRTPAAGLRKIESLWRGVGARVLRLSPEEHDAVVSRTSHLVQLAAAALVHCVLGDGESGQRQARERLCAGGFRDTTRVASGSAEMWRDIALANRPNLLQGVDAYIRELKRFQDLLRRADAEGLHQFYGEAGRTRDAWLKKRQSGAARVRPRTAAKHDANAS
jgi:prephenate dehydrogenase